jgi:hypothetical protein
LIAFLKSFAYNKKMKTIKARDTEHLKDLISREIWKSGVSCSLNHIDVSNVDDMKDLFRYVTFNGDVSQWDVSNVKDMSSMFYSSQFNGDIGKWDVSNVKDMKFMFLGSQFNGDISQWNISNVTQMTCMFFASQFNRDLSQWDVSKVESLNYMFCHSQFQGDLRSWGLSDEKIGIAFGETIGEYRFHRQMIEGREALKEIVGINDKRHKTNHRTL